jgi:quercetin dioxygenase-like cupin family protein
LIDFDAQIEHHFGAGVYIRKMDIPAGHYVVSHKHKYDHLSVLASGRVTVCVDGNETELTGPTVTTIQAGKHHTIVAKTDAVWMCIHGTNETTVDDIDDVLIEGVA